MNKKSDHSPVPPSTEKPAGVPVAAPPHHADTVSVTGINHEKNYVKTLIFSALFGYFGVDRFYLNKVGTGVAKLLTFGGLGIWVLVDFVITLVGAAREKDKPNLELEDTQKYKPFFIKLTVVCVAIYAVIWVLYIVLFVILFTLGDNFFTVPGPTDNPSLQVHGGSQQPSYDIYEN